MIEPEFIEVRAVVVEDTNFDLELWLSFSLQGLCILSDEIRSGERTVKTGVPTSNSAKIRYARQAKTYLAYASEIARRLDVGLVNISGLELQQEEELLARIMLVEDMIGPIEAHYDPRIINKIQTGMLQAVDNKQ